MSAKIIVVLPAYKAERTIAATIKSLPPVYDQIILCDDSSPDRTVEVAQSLGIEVLQHAHNRGYGANQKTLYAAALKYNPDIIVMVHPDNQYSAEWLSQGIEQILHNQADYVLGNRMAHARADGMPLWRYVSNRFLTFWQNWFFGSQLSEFHSGLRLYRASLIADMPVERFSDDFVFDSETIAWAFAHGYKFGQMPTRCFYGLQESSINFSRSLRYGLDTLKVLIRYKVGYYHRLGKRIKTTTVRSDIK